MRIVYVGESPARTISVTGGIITAVNGEPVEVPDDLAIGLDPAADAARFATSANGVVVIPKDHKLDPDPG